MACKKSALVAAINSYVAARLTNDNPLINAAANMLQPLLDSIEYAPEENETIDLDDAVESWWELNHKEEMQPLSGCMILVPLKLLPLVKENIHDHDGKGKNQWEDRGRGRTITMDKVNSIYHGSTDC